jgi:hypothetical protein
LTDSWLSLLTQNFAQIYTEKPPFPHLSDYQVILEVSNEGRPHKPGPESEAATRGMDDRLWNLAERCWDSEPKERPDMADVVKVLSTLHDSAS